MNLSHSSLVKYMVVGGGTQLNLLVHIQSQGRMAGTLMILVAHMYFPHIPCILRHLAHCMFQQGILCIQMNVQHLCGYAKGYVKY